MQEDLENGITAVKVNMPHAFKLLFCKTYGSVFQSYIFQLYLSLYFKIYIQILYTFLQTKKLNMGKNIIKA